MHFLHYEMNYTLGTPKTYFCMFLTTFVELQNTVSEYYHYYNQ